MNLSVTAAAGANVIVEPFKDPIGIDAIIEWPGGEKMQLSSDDRRTSIVKFPGGYSAEIHSALRR